MQKFLRTRRWRLWWRWRWRLMNATEKRQNDSCESFLTNHHISWCMYVHAHVGVLSLARLSCNSVTIAENGGDIKLQQTTSEAGFIPVSACASVRLSVRRAARAGVQCVVNERIAVNAKYLSTHATFIDLKHNFHRWLSGNIDLAQLVTPTSYSCTIMTIHRCNQSIMS